MKWLMKILAGIMLIVLYFLSPVVSLLLWFSGLGVKLSGGMFCLVGVLSWLEQRGRIGDILFPVFLGLVLIGVSPFFGFVSIFCEDVKGKLFAYVTGCDDETTDL